MVNGAPREIRPQMLLTFELRKQPAMDGLLRKIGANPPSCVTFAIQCSIMSQVESLPLPFCDRRERREQEGTDKECIDEHSQRQSEPELPQ